MLLLLSHFSRVRLCATPQMAAHQASPSLGFSRQEHWSGFPFLSPMHESKKRKGSRSVVSDSQRPHGLQTTRLLRPWIFQARVLEWGAIAFSLLYIFIKTNQTYKLMSTIPTSSIFMKSYKDIKKWSLLQMWVWNQVIIISLIGLPWCHRR